MATQYERYSNSAFTYLRTAINDVSVDIPVFEARRFPTNSNFRIRVGNELMLVTSVDTSNRTLTVTRGVAGTVAKAHDLGDLLISVLIQDGLDQMLTDRVLYAKTRPQYGQLSDKDGLKVAAADFSWHNQGSATATDKHGTIWMNGLRAAGYDGHYLFLTPPSTPWTFTVGFRPLIANDAVGTDGFSFAGLAIKNTGNVRTIQFGVQSRSPGTGKVGTIKTKIHYMTSATAFNSNEADVGWLRMYDEVIWHRITDNGTNLLFDLSRDGVNWTQLHTLGRTAWLTSGANQVGFVVDPAQTEVAGGTHIDNQAAFVHASFT